MTRTRSQNSLSIPRSATMIFINILCFTFQNCMSLLCKIYGYGFRQFLIMLLLMIFGSVMKAGAEAVEHAPTITNLMELRRLADSEPSLIELTNMDGTVLWSS